jgi:peptidoglycan/LPS O-acetylase OafA/YrhL
MNGYLNANRIGYLDGLRGLACLQVVVSHYTDAFSPGDLTWVSLFADAEAAVALFFLMSGFVLTSSFGKHPDQLVPPFLGRLIRLCVPSMAAILIAFALVSVGLTSARHAAQLAHSDWLGKFSASAPDLLPDLDGASLIFGFQHSGLFNFPWLPSALTSADTPIWTISVEIWGSLWVLALAFARHRSRPVYWAMLAASIGLAGMNEVALFTVGHCAARLMGRTETSNVHHSPWAQAVGWAFLIGGLLLASGHHDQPANSLAFLPRGVFCYYGFFHWQVECGAALMFFGILLTPALQHQLQRSLPRYLGRVSFSVYLLHYPILFCAGSVFFLVLAPSFGAHAAWISALALGMILSLSLANWFERCVDAPIVAFSRRVKTGRLGLPVKTAPVAPGGQ